MNEYIDPHKTILVIRRLGGVGDILMTRPIMRAIKERNPAVQLHYAIPASLIPLVADCDAIDAIIPFEELNETHLRGYRWHGDITRACIEHEIRFRSRVHTQRTDLWAAHLGIEINDHNEQFRFTEKEIEQVDAAILEKVPIPESLFFIAPYSADPRRNLTEEQVRTGIKWARGKGMNPVIIHGTEIPEFYDIPQIFGHSLRVWMAMATKAKMTFTTDTGAMHLFGYLRIPTAAMFCFTSGQVVPRHYPTVIPFQLHRDNVPGMSCCPCYDWGNCPYLKDGNRILKCVRDIPNDLIIEALEKAMVFDGMERHFDVVPAIQDKVTYPSMTISKIPGSVGKQISPQAPSIPMLLEIDMSNAEEIDAMVACGMATAIKSRHPETSVAAVNVYAKTASVLQLCPFLGIDNSGSSNQAATRIHIHNVSRNKNGWMKAMQDVIGIPTDGSAGLANSPTSVRHTMFEKYGERRFELRDIQGDPELDIPDKVWVQPGWTWEQKIACAKLSSKVYTDNEAMAFACASLGIPVIYNGNASTILRGMRLS